MEKERRHEKERERELTGPRAATSAQSEGRAGTDHTRGGRQMWGGKGATNNHNPDDAGATEEERHRAERLTRVPMGSGPGKRRTHDSDLHSPRRSGSARGARGAYDDPLAEVAQGADRPEGDDEDPGSGGESAALAEGPEIELDYEQREQDDSAPKIFMIQRGQAFAITADGDGGQASGPYGRPGQYGEANINPELGAVAHKLKMKYPHPDMLPCGVCYGLMGEGICRRDERCPLLKFREGGRCYNCMRRTEECRAAESECREALEAAVCVAAAMYEHIGHARYVKACPTDDMKDVTTKSRSTMWRGLRASTVTEATDITDWDIYSVVSMNAATGRAVVRGTGGTWDVNAQNLPEWILEQYAERQRKQGARTVSVADLVSALSDDSEEEDMAPPDHFTQQEEGVDRWTAKRTHNVPQLSMRQAADELWRQAQERKRLETETEERARADAALRESTRNVTSESAMVAAMQAMADTMRAMQEKMDRAKNEKPSTDSDDDDSDGALLSKSAYRQGGDIMAQLLEALDHDKEDLNLRPKLYFCLAARGYDQKFPFPKMQGDPRHMDIACMLDENSASAADKAGEQRQLQAVQGQGEGSLEAGKSGSLKLVSGKKPQLTRPAVTKKVTTKDDLFLALYGWAHHYGVTGMPGYQEQIMQHAFSLREIWQSRVLGSDAKALIDLDARLREYRCREGPDAQWTINNDTNSADQRILAKVIMEARSRNSKRPDADPSAAEKGGSGREGAPKKKPTPKKGGSSKGTGPPPKPKPAEPARATHTSYMPPGFFAMVAKESPDVCSNYAWSGKCPRSEGESCQHHERTFLHTCKDCRFEKGEHPIKEGKCPH